MAFWQPLEQASIDQIVCVAIENGIRFFDTAEAYGWGESERRLSAALVAAGHVRSDAREPGRIAVATKWFPGMRLARNISRSIDKRVDSLRPFGIDLYQIHNPFTLASIPAMMDSMAELQEKGLIRAVGVSNFSAEKMRLAHAELAKRGIPLASNQMHYSLLRRKIEGNGVLETAKELGIAIIAYSPLAQGVLTGAFHEDPERIKRRPGPRKWMPQFRADGLARSRPLVDILRRVGSQHQKTPAQIALAWLIRDDAVVAIPGASTPEQAIHNAGAMDVVLTDLEYEEISAASAVVQKGA